ncbi:MAG: HD-GYP domain-containing protein [Gemmatimonadaceae bacterium]
MSRIARYVLLVCIAAVGGGVAVFVRDPSFALPFAQAALTFGFVGVLTNLFAYRTGHGSLGSVSFIPVLASAAIAPHWLTVAVVAVASLAGQMIAKREAIRAVFNAAQQTLGMSLAILTYLAIGGVPLHSVAESSSPSLFALFLVFFMTNTICVSGALGIVGDRSVWAIWKENTFRALPYDFLSLPAILLIVWTYSKFGPVGVFVFAIPLFGLRQLYKVTGQLEQTNRELLELMVAAIEARDPYTSGHSRRVADKARVIAKSFGLSTREIERIVAAALLHDVGKIHEVFGPILSKPGRLTPEEQVIMRTHPVKSAELASKVTELRDVVPLIRHHHENWDGTGYPDGLKGDAIPLGSRIIMFADTIDAMTTDRPYRAALDAQSVRKELLRFRATQFDPAICDALLRSADFAKLFATLAQEGDWEVRTPERGTVLRAAVSA